MDSETTNIDLVWLLVCCSLVFSMQIGFLCLETGLTRTKNNINVAMKNVVDFGIASFAFWVVGYGIMYGDSWRGLIGYTLKPFESSPTEPATSVLFLFALMFCGTAITIVSGAVAERMHFLGYVVVSILVSAIVYPVFAHWAWSNSPNGLGWLAEIGFVDFAGSTVVHSVGGWISLAAILIIGPRFGRYTSKAKRNPYTPNNLPTAMCGVLILVIGWMGFNGGSGLSFGTDVPLIIINSIMASGAGLLAAMTYLRIKDGYFSPLAMIVGPLAGLVAITASANVVSTPLAIMIGAIGSVCACVATSVLDRLKIDDVVGAVPVHLIAGIWGTLAVGFFGNLELLGTGLTRNEQIVTQLTGIGACGAWAFGLSFILLVAINYIYPLRVSEESEKLGLNIAEHNARSETSDLIGIMSEQSYTHNLSLRAHIEPNTDVGQIAFHYNALMDSLESTVAQIADRQAWINAIVDTAPDGIFTLSSSHTIDFVNLAVQDLFGYSTNELIGMPVSALFEPQSSDLLSQTLMQNEASIELRALKVDGTVFDVAVSIGVHSLNEELIVLTIHDISVRINLQNKLLSAQKLESIGQLAAGIAHEINTPIQFVGDNTKFLRDNFKSLLDVIHMYTDCFKTNSGGNVCDAKYSEIKELIDNIDFDFVIDEIPLALEQTLEGVERITEIVLAMKDFSHPSCDVKTHIDLNQAIKSTLTVCRNRWKFVAELVTDFAENIPPVSCYAGELNQVILNIVVNAADAISENMGENSDTLGLIKVTTRHQGKFVEIRISDTGGGIPLEIRHRIFDPFFTTKIIGKGTGQGLAISHEVIVNKHEGTIVIEVEEGVGSTFVIRLPTDNENALWATP